MSGTNDHDLLRAAFAPARTLEPSPAEVARVMARVPAPRRSRRFPVPPTEGDSRRPRWRRCWRSAPASTPSPHRAAIESAAGSVAEAFRGYQRGDTGDAPGRPLTGRDRAPEYFGDRYDGRRFARQPRVLAAAGGYRLFAYRSPSGSLSFDLGDTGVGMGFPSADAIGPGALVVLGAGAMRHADAEGHVPCSGWWPTPSAKSSSSTTRGRRCAERASKGGSCCWHRPLAAPAKCWPSMPPAGWSGGNWSTTPLTASASTGGGTDRLIAGDGFPVDAALAATLQPSFNPVPRGQEGSKEE